MTLNQALPFVATIVMLLFAAIVLQRFAQRRHISSLFWGVGLLMFAIGTFAEAYLAVAWNEVVFRSWYVFGAMLNAGWLGHGTLTLLVRRPWVRSITLALVVLSLIGLLATFTISLNSTAYMVGQPVAAQYKEILPKGAPIRLLTPLFNVYGTIFLVGGAIYSAYLFWRKQTMLHRVVGNVLIAAGALVIASAGTLTRLFFGDLLAVAELSAAVLMFAGFMVASSPIAARHPVREQAQRA